MKQGFKRIYPGKARLLFDGGKNSKYERSLIEDNESPDCANVVFDNGSVGTRPGTTKLNTAAVTTTAFDGLYTRRSNTNSETMVAFAGGSMYQLAGTSFTTIPSAQSVFTVGARVGTSQFQNYMFIGNGGVIPYKWDGSVFSRHGVYSPVSTATVGSAGVAGNLTPSAEYQYKFTYVNTALVESDVSPVTATFIVSSTSGQNNLSGIPVAPQSWGVNTRRIYRNAAGGSSFKRVATLADNTTTIYTDNIADSSLGVTAPTDNGVPPKYNAIIYHQNRLFMNDPANPNYVWYTTIGTTADPYTVASTNFFKVGDNATDLVKGFGVYDNAVLVFCENSVWINYMPSADPADWLQIRCKSPHGSKSPYSILNYNDKQLFPALQNGKFVGLGSIKGNTEEVTVSNFSMFSVGSETKSDRIEPDMFQVVESLLTGISGIVYKNKAYITLPYGAGVSANNRIYVYDFSLSNLRKSQEGSWVPWTGLSANQFTVYDGNLYYASSSTDGFVFKFDSNVSSDNGTAIDSFIWTKEYSGADDEYNLQKDFRYANILIENVGAYYMNIRYRTNSDSGSGNINQVSVNPGGSLWGTMRWGIDAWGGGSTQVEFRQFLGQARGKRVQFRFDNQNVAGQKFKVHGLNFLYNVKGYR